MCCTLIVGFQDLFLSHSQNCCFLFKHLYSKNVIFWKVSSRRHVMSSCHIWNVPNLTVGGDKRCPRRKETQCYLTFLFSSISLCVAPPSLGPVQHTNKMTETEGACVMWSASNTQVHRICYLLLEVGIAIPSVNQRLFQKTLWVIIYTHQPLY